MQQLFLSSHYCEEMDYTADLFYSKLEFRRMIKHVLYISNAVAISLRIVTTKYSQIKLTSSSKFSSQSPKKQTILVKIHKIQKSS